MALVTGLTIGAATAARASDEPSVAFVQTNLDSNIAGRAKVTDANLATYDAYYQYHDPITFKLQARREATLVTQVMPQRDLMRT